MICYYSEYDNWDDGYVLDVTGKEVWHGFIGETVETVKRIGNEISKKFDYTFYVGF